MRHVPAIVSSTSCTLIARKIYLNSFRFVKTVTYCSCGELAGVVSVSHSLQGSELVAVTDAEEVLVLAEWYHRSRLHTRLIFLFCCCDCNIRTTRVLAETELTGPECAQEMLQRRICRAPHRASLHTHLQTE